MYSHDLEVDQAIKDLRAEQKEKDENIPEEFWQNLGELLSDSRAYYRGFYVAPNYKDALRLGREALEERRRRDTRRD
ncbi:MAG: hypothetical protein AAB871_00865 [Patescibacteria group bacterium]